MMILFDGQTGGRLVVKRAERTECGLRSIAWLALQKTTGRRCGGHHLTVVVRLWFGLRVWLARVQGTAGQRRTVWTNVICLSVHWIRLVYRWITTSLVTTSLVNSRTVRQLTWTGWPLGGQLNLWGVLVVVLFVGGEQQLLAACDQRRGGVVAVRVRVGHFAIVDLIAWVLG